jgi:hypothetical protein
VLVTPVMLIAVDALFVIVTGSGVLEVFTFWLKKEIDSELGVTVTGGIALPATATVCGEFAALSLMVSVAVV